MFKGFRSVSSESNNLGEDDMRALMHGTLLGYDPGGNGKHGVARVTVRAGEVARDGVFTATVETAEDALQWLLQADSPLGCGIDTLTVWATGKSGLRPADTWLREHYPSVRLSVVPPNSLYGSMAVGGAAVVLPLLERWPNLVVSETHPKVLYYALSGKKYDWKEDRSGMTDLLSSSLGCSLPELRTDHEWDALISAYAVWQGLAGSWTRDLLELPLSPKSRLVWPLGKTQYFWPEEE